MSMLSVKPAASTSAVLHVLHKTERSALSAQLATPAALRCGPAWQVTAGRQGLV